MILFAQLNLYIRTSTNILTGEHDGDAGPTRDGKTRVRASQFQVSDLAKLEPLLSELITNNQLLILLEINKSTDSITPLLLRLSKRENVPLSTLKSSTKALKKLGMIRFMNSSPVEVTPTGSLALRILSISTGDINE